MTPPLGVQFGVGSRGTFLRNGVGLGGDGDSTLGKFCGNDGGGGGRHLSKKRGVREVRGILLAGSGRRGKMYGTMGSASVTRLGDNDGGENKSRRVVTETTGSCSSGERCLWVIM
ncbi:hypothetical protein B0H14DRAFT_2575784 [Mycena olivaceomarginata]|nr:hypothetical protein B0H14DRAFT_2575784 [Mycena olivaceomarginata]